MYKLLVIITKEAGSYEHRTVSVSTQVIECINAATAQIAFDRLTGRAGIEVFRLYP